MSNLAATKKRFKPFFRSLVKNPPSGLDLSESAIPAYAHRNPLIDFIFWGRLRAVEKIALRNRPTRILDFGCGSGVASYLLAQSGFEIFTTDIEPVFFRTSAEHIEFPKNVRFISPAELSKFPNGYFDVIIALDVLEHIENLDEPLSQFKRLLNNDGHLIVSGPTENTLYKLGRKLAGKRFHGSYHVADIYTAERAVDSRFRIVNIHSLLPVFPLFRIIDAKQK